MERPGSSFPGIPGLINQLINQVIHLFLQLLCFGCLFQGRAGCWGFIGLRLSLSSPGTSTLLGKDRSFMSVQGMVSTKNKIQYKIRWDKVVWWRMNRVCGQVYLGRSKNDFLNWWQLRQNSRWTGCRYAVTWRFCIWGQERQVLWLWGRYECGVFVWTGEAKSWGEQGQITEGLMGHGKEVRVPWWCRKKKKKEVRVMTSRGRIILQEWELRGLWECESLILQRRKWNPCSGSGVWCGRERQCGKERYWTWFPGQVLFINKKWELKIATCPLVFIVSIPGGFWRPEEKRGSGRREGRSLFVGRKLLLLPTQVQPLKAAQWPFMNLMCLSVWNTVSVLDRKHEKIFFKWKPL